MGRLPRIVAFCLGIALAASRSINLLTGALETACGRGKLRFTQSGPRFSVRSVEGTSDIVTGSFDDQLDSVGWMYLSLHANASFNNYQQAYAAGYAEGAVTTERTWQSLSNAGAINATLPGPVFEWIYNNTAFMHAQILSHPNVPYWHQLTLLLIQTQGLADGYNDHALPGQRVSIDTFYVMNLGGDLDDLMWLAGDAEIVAATASPFGRLRRCGGAT
jgi:hypothetical protein